MIFISFKTYQEGTGKKAVFLSKIANEVSKETGIPIICSLQATDIYRVKQSTKASVWAQHVDPIDPGRHFGWISPYSVKEAGAEGVIINHAEHPIFPKKIKLTIEKAKEYGLKTLVIADSEELTEEAASWRPDFVAFEDRNLIAGSVSMIDIHRETIKRLAKKISQPFIIGAGISKGEDIIQSIQVGAKGVILASAFIKSPNPKEKLLELARSFNLV